MQFLYTKYVYINTRDIKGNLMFVFGPQFHMHGCCSNPFGATIANPRINFALGIAAATAMPMYQPYTPIFGYGFGFNRVAYAPMPTFGTLTTQNYTINAPTHNYAQYFNRIPQINFNTYSTPTFNVTSNNQNSSNPFGYFNNFNNIKINTINGGTISTNNKTTSNEQEVANVDDTRVSTDGITLNRNNDNYGPEFLAKVKQIAARLGCDYRDLLGLMNSESGIDASIKNPNGSASGLIQFIESTARSLGTTTAELRAMKPIDQLDYVEKYLANAKANAGITGKLSAGDLYSLVFLPGRASRNVLTSSGENYYAHNRGLDLNKDGQITKAELGQRIHDKRVSDNSFLA